MRKTIRFGSTGVDVKYLQEKLREGDYYGGEISGAFDTVLQAAVMAFQANNGLKADGIVGRLTWEIIDAGWEEEVNPATEEIGYADEPPWLTVARSKIGVREISGAKNNPEIVGFHGHTGLSANDDETPWCASFACSCLEHAGFKSPHSAAAISFLSWGKKLAVPKIGCIVVMSRPGGNHVGFYVGGDSQTVKLLGGNQSDQVKVSSFQKSIVKGYRWPA